MIVQAKSLFEDFSKKVQDGSVRIEQLKLITTRTCSKQFEDLHKALHGENVKVNIPNLLKARQMEIRTLETHIRWNDCLLKMCRTIDPG